MFFLFSKFFNNHQRKLVLKIVCFVELLACIVAGGIGFYLYSNTNTFLSHASHAQGTVIGLLQHEISEDHSISHYTIYYPEIAFTDKTGRTINFYSKDSSSPPDYVKGDKVNVIYDPKNPSNAKIDSFTTLWVRPIIAFVASIFALIFSCGFFVWSKYIPNESS